MRRQTPRSAARTPPLQNENNNFPTERAPLAPAAFPHLRAREVDHRISNSLQLIAALLSLEERRIGDSTARRALTDARRRVTTVAHLHRHLCKMETVEFVELDDFLHGLFDDLRSTFLVDAGRITLLVNVDPIIVSPAMARDLGLIVNELATNALKHAFPANSKGLVQIACGLDIDGQISLDVSDDGIAYRPDDQPATSSGLGMKIVEMLVAQLKGRIEVVTSDSRLIHKITVPLP